MKSTDDLFSLIQSLSPAEKRSFKLYYEGMGEAPNKNYMALFDDMNKEKSYQEADFLRTYTDRPYISNFSWTKNHLFGQILDAMRAHNDKGIEFKIREMVEDAIFLRRRKLFDASSRRLRQARKKAEEFEKHEILLEILRLQRTIEIEEQDSDYLQSIDKLHQEIETVTELIRNKFILLRLRDRLFLLVRGNSPALMEDINLKIDALMTDPHLQDKEKALSFDARHNFFFTWALYHQLKGNWMECWEAYRQQLLLWDQNKHQQKENRVAYRNLIYNFLNLSNELHHYHNFVDFLDRMEAGPFLSEEDKEAAIQNGLFVRVQYFINHYQWEDSEAIVREVERMENSGDRIIRSRKMAFYLSFSWHYFLLGQNVQSLRWLNQLFNLPKSPIRHDLSFQSRLLELVILYEEGESEMLEGRYRSLQRLTQLRPEKGKFELLALGTFGELQKRPEAEKEVLSILRADLEPLQKDPIIQKSPGLEMINIWLSAKLSGKTVRQIWEERMGK